MLGFALVTDAMSLVVVDNALTANVDLISFTEELRSLIRMLQTVLLSRHLFCLLLTLFLLLCDMLLTVEIVKNREVFDELLDIW